MLGLAAPHVDLEERGFAVARLPIVLDALGDGDAQVGDRGAGVGEAELGVLDQVAGDGGLVVGCHHGSFALVAAGDSHADAESRGGADSPFAWGLFGTHRPRPRRRGTSAPPAPSGGRYPLAPDPA